MKVLKVLWTGQMGNVCLCVTENSAGEKKIRCASTSGENEVKDTEYAATYGVELKKDQILELIHELNTIR